LLKDGSVAPGGSLFRHRGLFIWGIVFQASVTLHGVDELRSRLLKLERKVGRRILAKGLRAGAKTMQSALEKASPVGPDNKPHTHMRDAWKVKAGKRSSVKVDYFAKLSSQDIHPTNSKAGKRAWYPSAVEYGSHDSKGNVHIEARGSMRKAFEQAGPRARDTILQVFADELEKAVAEH
jgi:HK97 gp10 family phage protein